MKDSHRAEDLKAGTEARRSAESRPGSTLDAIQSALRRYLSADTYRRQAAPKSPDGTPGHAPDEATEEGERGDQV